MISRFPLIVAEVSANHRGSFETAIELVRAIAAAGASHVKFQTYTADTMTLNDDGPAFRVPEGHQLWGGRTLYSLYDEAHTPWEWHEKLFAESRRLGLIPFSSPFDHTAVDFLETFNPDLYKVASLEIGDLPLISRIAQTRRPMIISTGAATLAEVDDAVATAQSCGCADITLLVCTSSYPAKPADAHLGRISFLRDRYGVSVGLSDHTKGTAVSVAAAALGAQLIERHVTLRRIDGGPDSAFSMEPHELHRLIKDVRDAHEAIGQTAWPTIISEDSSRALKRSLYITADCGPGELLTPINVRAIRPNGGLSPKHYPSVLGRRLRDRALRGTPLTLDMIESDPT